MIAFQIFDKPFPPCEPYFGYMRKVQSLSESYTLIAPENFMGSEFYPLADLVAALPEYLIENQNGRTYYDALRAKYLSEHFDNIYLDIDVELLSPIELKSQPQEQGPGVLVGNGDPELGRRCWETYLSWTRGACRPATYMFYGINTLEVEDAYLVHHYARGKYFE